MECRGEALPPYSDPAYGCQMELLRFDSRYPNPRFSPLVREVESQLADSLVISGNPRSNAIGRDQLSVEPFPLAPRS